jgi:hypothetical protein
MTPAFHAALCTYSALGIPCETPGLGCVVAVVVAVAIKPDNV